jgi:hypothetical protein
MRIYAFNDALNDTVFSKFKCNFQHLDPDPGPDPEIQLNTVNKNPISQP